MFSLERALSGGPESVIEEMEKAVALVVPSICYENFPRVIVEAYSVGLPVIASRLGALAELVEDGITGLLFNPGDSKDLAKTIKWAYEHKEAMVEMGRRGRLKFENEFCPEKNYEQLKTIYGEAVSAFRCAKSSNTTRAIL